jgi:MFS transporter, ACS family, hexuronate transporter
MMFCRGLLGFFEAGHWPCALIVTQSILASGQRVMGNSILQSGASLGAICTPIIIRFIVGDQTAEDAWRMPFLVIGSVGVLWVILWLRVVRPADLSRPVSTSSAADGSTNSEGAFDWLWDLVRDRRFWALVLMVVAINTSWQLVRAWLPKFLQQGRGYSEAESLYFNSVYFVATDVGCIAAGLLGLWIARQGVSVHRSRVIVFLICSLLAAMTGVAAWLPNGWWLLATLLCVAGGTLGVFPCYYSFTQELSITRMGRVTGVLSFLGWLASSPMQKLFGKIVDERGSFDLVIGVLGFFPLLGLVAFLILWPRTQSESLPHAVEA